ncbi:MAG: hypothetical protein KAI70_00160 [Candidatus Omnitrophica bacterium]|nr:hypothetical protein [Candidatus Omnitrophota bacterium]
MKKLFMIVIIVAILFNISAFASTNKPLQNLGEGLDNIVYGKVEVPDNMNETSTKGSPAFTDCTDTTKDDVGRGIARFVGGVWQIATFWYPES